MIQNKTIFNKNIFSRPKAANDGLFKARPALKYAFCYQQLKEENFINRQTGLKTSFGTNVSEHHLTTTGNSKGF